MLLKHMCRNGAHITLQKVLYYALYIKKYTYKAIMLHTKD